MSFFWATCALILSILACMSSTSPFSARSTQPIIARTATAGTTDIRIFMGIASTFKGRARGREPCAGPGIISVGRGRKNPESGFQDPNVPAAADDLADHRGLL